MIKLHWMQNDMSFGIEYLESISSMLDESKYYSVLLPFHSESPDQWMQAARVLNKNHKIKYMIALRPYHVSPQYFAMLVKAFNLIDDNRLIVNILAGDVHNRSDEKNQFDVYGNTDTLLTIEQRKVFVRNFLYECKNMNLLNNMPQLVLSGLSDFTISTANIFNSTILCMYDDYFKNIDRLKECSNKMVSVKLYIRDFAEEAEEINNHITVKRHKDFTIYGTEDYVAKKLKELINIGVTDVLVGAHHFDDKIEKIHSFVKKCGGIIYE